jgi:mycothiol system anti-sigma-R factor
MNEETTPSAPKARCREALAQLYLYLDGESLSEQRRLEIKEHLDDCPPCGERFYMEELVVKLVAHAGECTECPDSLKIKIKNLIQEF